MQAIEVSNFEQWRSEARRLLQNGVAAAEVQFLENDGQQALFSDRPIDEPEDLSSEHGLPNHEDRKNAEDGCPKQPTSKPSFNVPREFIRLAKNVSYHRDPRRWAVLYRALWRITHGEKELLKISTDDDVLLLNKMLKEVSRDAHKMKAFVRFRKVVRDGAEHFIAWYRPDHRIVRKVAPFFSRRFKCMNWTILTPNESVTWDQHILTYGLGVPRSEAPVHDNLEELWLTYYGSIFNPARVKVKMMKSEMPVRHWQTLPEAQIILDLLHDAPDRAEKMIEAHEGFATTAASYLPTNQPTSLQQLQYSAATCQACDLYRDATQAVFGIGPANAKLVLVGEQPGDAEDLSGTPFVGPAGKILNEALEAAGIERDKIYITNIVKHFKHKSTQTAKGKKRLHAKPSAREVRCCKPWFDAEWDLLQDAEVLVCLGSTVATAIISPGFRVSNQRGFQFSTDYCVKTMATWHPSSILRVPAAGLKAQRMAQLIADLQKAQHEIDK